MAEGKDKKTIIKIRIHSDRNTKTKGSNPPEANAEEISSDENTASMKPATKYLEDASVSQGTQEAKSTETELPRTDESTENGYDIAKDFKMFQLEETADNLISSSDFLGAIPHLEKLLPMQQGYNKLKTQMIMAECYLQAPKLLKAVKIIEEIIQCTLNSDNMNSRSMVELAEHYSTGSNHQIRACILLQCASKFFKRDWPPNEAVEGIEQCVFKCCGVVTELSKEEGRLRVVASDLVLPAMQEILEDLREVKGADPDTKVIKETKCLLWIGSSYRTLGQHSDSLISRNEGIQIMQRHFATDATKYNIYGLLLQNIGFANHSLGNYAQAESFYLQSIEVFEGARDWPNEVDKESKIVQTKKHLQDVRSELEKGTK